MSGGEEIRRVYWGVVVGCSGVLEGLRGMSLLFGKGGGEEGDGTIVWN